jgi:subtilase family protein
MKASKRFASSFGMLTGISRLALGAFLGFTPSCALDDGSAADLSSTDGTAGDDGEDISSQSVCNGGHHRCLAQILTFGAERSRSPRAVSPLAVPAGFGPADLQSAYGIDPYKLATTTPPLVAITDAFGYPKLEADLAVYRQTYGLPACTTASGCLKIVNQQGQTTNLPSAPPASDDWTVETALDVDMVSAACPRCRILVVQANDDTSNQQGVGGLEIAQNTAVSLGATVISDSWGATEEAGAKPAQDRANADTTYYNHPGVAIFVASGDNGYDDSIQTTPPPPAGGYPATSQYTIAVGGTHLVRTAGTARGWTESAWGVALSQGQVDPTRGAGGSGCSLSIPKPAYQSASPCAFKATADIAAVGDPQTGVAVYNTNGTNKGWSIVGGTSAAAPFVAAIFAATGNGSQTSGQFIANNASKLFDVTGGSNGTCPAGQELLCTARAGWDGPTGFGTPNVKLLMPATATGPGAGNGAGNGTGAANGNGGGSGSNDSGITSGCSAGGGAGLLLGLALLGLRRRKR